MLNVMLGGQQVFKELSFLLDNENREGEWTSASEKRKKRAEIVVIRSFLPKNSKSMALIAGFIENLSSNFVSLGQYDLNREYL